LGDVETAAIALRKTEHHGDLAIPRRVSDFLSERTIVAQGIVEVALDEALRDRPRRRSHPDVPRIARNPGFREGDQFRALFCGFLDVSDGLGDRALQVDPDRRRLHDCRFVPRMSDAHGSSLL